MTPGGQSSEPARSWTLALAIRARHRHHDRRSGQKAVDGQRLAGKLTPIVYRVLAPGRHIEEARRIASRSVERDVLCEAKRVDMGPD